MDYPCCLRVPCRTKDYPCSLRVPCRTKDYPCLLRVPCSKCSLCSHARDEDPATMMKMKWQQLNGETAALALKTWPWLDVGSRILDLFALFECECFAESTAVISVLPQQRTNEANETKKTVNCFASDTFVSHATDVFVSNTDAFNKPNLDLIADHPPSILSLLHISPLYSL